MDQVGDGAAWLPKRLGESPLCNWDRLVGSPHDLVAGNLGELGWGTSNGPLWAAHLGSTLEIGRAKGPLGESSSALGVPSGAKER